MVWFLCLFVCFRAMQVQRMRQKVTSVVPVLYQMLSAASSSSVQRENVRQVLHGKPWVFVGDRFVHAEQVAFVSQVRADTD